VPEAGPKLFHGVSLGAGREPVGNQLAELGTAVGDLGADRDAGEVVDAIFDH
jgi:hypothetical protein